MYDEVCATVAKRSSMRRRNVQQDTISGAEPRDNDRNHNARMCLSETNEGVTSTS